MKCPKCSYNSFELYDSCKKCGTDLAAFKQTHAIRPIVHPPQFIADESLPPAAFAAAAPIAEEEMPVSAGTAEAMSWDLPSDEGSVEENGFAGFDLDFSVDEDKEEPQETFSGSGNSASLEGFGEFSFDDDTDTSASDLDDLLSSDEPDTSGQADSNDQEFGFDDEEFALESNSLSFKEESADADEFDFDGLLTDEPPAEEPTTKPGPSIDLKDIDSDWPSFLETDEKEKSDK